MNHQTTDSNDNQMFPNDYQDELVELSKLFGVYKEVNGTQVFIYGVAEEAGEVLGLFKRLHRGDFTPETQLEFQEKLESELGDLLGYLSLLAAKYGISLADIMEMSLKKIRDRGSRGVLKGSGSLR